MFCIQPLSEPLLVLKCILTFQDAIVCMCFLINLILKFLGYYFFSFECLGDFQLFILVRIFQLQISKASEVEIEEQLEVEQLKKHSSTFYEWLGIRRKGSYAPPPPFYLCFFVPIFLLAPPDLFPVLTTTSSTSLVQSYSSNKYLLSFYSIQGQLGTVVGLEDIAVTKTKSLPLGACGGNRLQTT